METTDSETGAKKHLNNVLSESEIANIPEQIADKINSYIDHTFEEYLTAKALHETNRSQLGEKIVALESQILETTAKYEETTRKLTTSDETIKELGEQIETLNSNLEKAQEKIERLENEITSLKSSRDAAIDERNDLTRILQRRDAEIERISVSEAAQTQQLRAAIDAKCEALALNDEIQSKELSLQYREKRIEQERTLLNSQISSLSDEVNRLTSELQTVRLNNTSRLVSLETQLAQKVEELNAANDTIALLSDNKKNLNARAENLTHRLAEQREIENKMTENYKKELDAKTKLADLYKSMLDDAEAKTLELTEGIGELQKLLNEATEKYGDLETKFKQAELDHEELMEKKNEIISSLKSELEHANDFLKAANAHNLDMALNELAPSAATASKLLKSGMSLTQIYSQLVKVSDELAQEKEENRRLNITINTIVQELEEKAPLLQKQKAEYEEAIDSNTALSQQIEALVIECNRLRDDHNESSKISNHFSRENTKLKGELADLGRQVCFLLKEIEHSRAGLLPNGDHDSSRRVSNSSSSETGSSRIISKTLVTFSDIQELQSNNQKLLRMVRELTEKQEELEQHKEQFESGEMQTKIESLKNRVSELIEAQERQTKMVNGLIRQRDMFKKLYHDLMKGKRLETSIDEAGELDKSGSFILDTSTEKINKQISNETLAHEIKCKEIEKQLELLKEEYKTYKEEKITNEKMLIEQIDNMRQEIAKLTAANSKCASTSEYNNERLKILQTNVATYKKQIASLEEKNKAYNATIAKHEVSLQHLRDEALNAQSKFAAAEIQVENLKLQCKLLKDSELRLQTEKEMLNRERQGQSLLLKNLELIKASLERVEAENRTKLETRLDEATRECSALRRRLQEEQDRFRELASHLERQTETAKARMQEEKDAADVLRKEISEMRQDMAKQNKAHEELTKKLKTALAPSSNEAFDTVRKIRELENKLSDKQGEVQSLQEQLKVAQEHIKQYCDISEGAEKELKTLNTEYINYKSETEVKLKEYSQKLQSLEEKCAELEAELSLHSNGEHASNITTLKHELANAKDDLKNALANIDNYRTELGEAREEITKLSEAVQKAEEKYTHEMILHSNDIQALSQVKEDLTRAQNELNELVLLKNNTIEKLQTENSSWLEREKILTNENEQLTQRLKDLNDQNSLLHEQIQALGTRLSVSHASRSQSDSINDSANDSSINISISDDDVKSSEQLFQIVKFLRKEKDIALAKFDILQAETMRLKSQLEIAEKQLDDTKIALATEREKSEISIVTVNKQSDILRKVETLNALTDSNRILREERDSLSRRIEELTTALKTIENQLGPLQESNSEYSSKNETLLSENNSLKADCARWRSRVNALVERANKNSPDDWKRLQNERETLAKMLTTEKENVRKLNEELSIIKEEKSKIEIQYSNLSRQHNNLVEENKKLNEQINTLQEDTARLSEEITKLKVEISTATESNLKLTEDLSSKDALLSDIRNKEMQIRKIAKKYKTQYEELVKSMEEEKKKSEGQIAAADAAVSENTKKMEEQLTDLQSKLENEKLNNEKLKQELENLKSVNLDREEKSKQVLKQAKSKIVQLTETKNTLTRNLEDCRSKLTAMEQSTKEEQDVRLALIKSQYEGRLSRLEKERGEAQTEKTREVEALMQKVNMLQRQLATQSSTSKQQATADKTSTEPPTANIKPMAGVVQQSVTASRRGGETPLASIRPMAQVGPTAPHDAHSTEYMPASSSRPLPRAALAASTAPPESTQDMDTSEAVIGVSGPSDSAQPSSHSQPPQQAVAMVMPRIEQPSNTTSATTSVPTASSAQATVASPAIPAPTLSVGASGTGSASVSAAATGSGGVSTSQIGAGVSTSQAAVGTGASLSPPAAGPTVSVSASVSTTRAPGDQRGNKRRLQSRPLTAKRTRIQGFERSVDVEYQVPTSSRCDQDDEGVIVVDSEEDDERCTGTMYREGEEDDEDIEEEQEVEAGEEEEEVEGDDGDNAARQESPVQSPEVAGEGSGSENDGNVGGGSCTVDVEPAPPAAAELAPAPHQQIEAISSGTEPTGTLSLGSNGGEDADDSIVPSTPTLYVPRRNDGFGEAVVSPLSGSGSGGAGSATGARFTFTEAGGGTLAHHDAHHDTHADLASAMPPPHHDRPPTESRAEGAEARDWEETRAEEESTAVSSQGSEPSSPRQIAEEGREAEASAPAVAAVRSTPSRSPHSPHSNHPAPPHNQRWMRADSESGARGRGSRSRGRPPRRSHNYMRF